MENLPVNRKIEEIFNQVKQRWSIFMVDHRIFTIGLSGGLDSIVLLHILCRLRQLFSIEVQAIHVHHGLSIHADEWAQFCHEICQKWQVTLSIKHVQVQSQKMGVEAAARQARYQEYAKVKTNILALAHHQDDQVETFYLGSLRGGGLRSLSAMPALRNLTADILLWRPLLSFSQQQLIDYAQYYHLHHVEDDSNQDTSYKRNWLRLKGLPFWREHMMDLNKQVLASVKQLQEELAIVDEIRLADWQEIHQQGYFDVEVWQKLSHERKKQQIHFFTQQHQLGTVRAVAIDEFFRQMNEEAIKSAELSLPNGKMIYYDDKLWFFYKNSHKQFPWLAKMPTLIVVTQNKKEINLQWQRFSLGLPKTNTEYKLRIVEKSDVIRLKNGHKSVKKMLQENKIPPFLRQIWPIICNNQNQCIAVINFCVAVDCGVKNGYLPIMNNIPTKKID